MPICQIQTNRHDSELRDGLENRIVSILAQTLSKPEERCSVFITTGVRLSRKGTSEPALCCTISAVNVFDAERNPQYARAFFKVLTEEFNVPEDRCVLLYNPIEVHQVAVPAPN